MAARAGRNVCAQDRLAKPGVRRVQHFLADIGHGRRRKRGPLRGKIIRHFLQILRRAEIREDSSSAGNCGGRSGTRGAGCRDSRRFSRQSREIDVAGAFALGAVTRCASENPGRHGVGGMLCRLSRRSIHHQQRPRKQAEVNAIPHQSPLCRRDSSFNYNFDRKNPICASANVHLF